MSDRVETDNIITIIIIRIIKYDNLILTLHDITAMSSDTGTNQTIMMMLMMMIMVPPFTPIPFAIDV